MVAIKKTDENAPPLPNYSSDPSAEEPAADTQHKSKVLEEVHKYLKTVTEAIHKRISEECHLASLYTDKCAVAGYFLLFYTPINTPASSRRWLQSQSEAPFEGLLESYIFFYEHCDQTIYKMERVAYREIRALQKEHLGASVR